MSEPVLAIALFGFAAGFLWAKFMQKREDNLNAAIRVQDSTLKEPDSKSRNTSKMSDSMKGTE